MTTLDGIRLCIDFGLVVLIWMVQRIVYPGFLQYSKRDLVTWHKQYTPAIASIVGPLMCAQLGIALYQCSLGIDAFSVSYLCIILIIWISTAYTFVPLHRKLSTADFTDQVPKQLVVKNWVRTLLWTALFVYSLIHALGN